MVESLLVKSGIALCKSLHKTGPQVMGQEIANIVEKHSIGAAAASLGVAWLPGAGATAAMAACAGFVWSMYFRINSKIGVPFSKNIIKSLATAIGANLAAGAISSVVVSSVLSFVPGIGNIAASALMAGVAFSLTWSCGLVYLKVLTRFAEANVDLGKVGEEDLKAMAKDVIAKENVKEMMKQAKNRFKEAKERGDIRKDGNNVKPMDEK